MTCPVCQQDPCTCPDTFYGPMTPDDWVDSLNASLQDLAYGKELEDNQVMGFAGVRWATAWEALAAAGAIPQWNEERGEYQL